ncbi:MAG: hypothetical protein BWX80_00126 [Candidatus Hydrogenedentes bacterium ADurb.Bin101]|nr:MAG: hypothetical protein BWX80_00126 [Candidatus Hydrogenedentes bacterium ADurb.Bin101]
MLLSILVTDQGILFVHCTCTVRESTNDAS